MRPKRGRRRRQPNPHDQSATTTALSAIARREHFEREATRQQLKRFRIREGKRFREHGKKMHEAYDRRLGKLAAELRSLTGQRRNTMPRQDES